MKTNKFYVFIVASFCVASCATTEVERPISYEDYLDFRKSIIDRYDHFLNETQKVIYSDPKHFNDCFDQKIKLDSMAEATYAFSGPKQGKVSSADYWLISTKIAKKDEFVRCIQVAFNRLNFRERLISGAHDAFSRNIVSCS